MNPNAIPRPRTSGTAIASLVCGLLGCIPFLTGLAAVVLGIFGIRSTRDPLVTGRGMAIAGLILGALGLVGWTLWGVALGSGALFYYKSVEPARVIAEEFTRVASEGKVDEALALSAEGLDRESLVALCEKLKPLGAFQELDANPFEFQAADDRAEVTIAGDATFANATRGYTMTLRKQGLGYKVAKFDFP